MARVSLRLVLIAIPLITIFFTALHLNLSGGGLPAVIREHLGPPLPPIPLPRHPIFKEDHEEGIPPPVVENFPFAQAAHSAADLPPIPAWNRPPNPHLNESTPLMIAFTRNWRILQQAVVGYIVAGWPPEDIYVIENTGAMDSNERGQLTLQNPFFLNHTRLHMLGVNIIRTPALLTFAQLQNLMIHEALEHKWKHYFWSHMDVAVLSEENHDPFVSLYMGAVEALRKTRGPDYPRWAQVLFAYDRLALVNTEAYVDVGGWDNQIPYYMTDCDMHERLDMAGWDRREMRIGQVSDIGSSVDDLLVYYRKTNGPSPSFVNPNDPPIPANEKIAIAEKQATEAAELVKKLHASRAQKARRAEVEYRDAVHLWNPTDDDAFWPSAELNSDSYAPLIHTLEHMDAAKNAPDVIRNRWQQRQSGGMGEPYFKDARGFEKGLWMWVEAGREVFAQKWGHRDCDLRKVGLKLEHAWKVQNDWEILEQMYRERQGKWKIGNKAEVGQTH